MQITFPPPPPSIGAIPSFLVAFLRQLTQAFASVISSSQVAPRVILQSPNGTVYVLTVNDSGALVVGDKSTLPKNL